MKNGAINCELIDKKEEPVLKLGSCLMKEDKGGGKSCLEIRHICLSQRR